MPASLLHNATLLATILLASASITQAQGINGNDSAIVNSNIGAGSEELYQYIRQNLPLRNSTDYPLRYSGFNWSGPAEDNGLWTISMSFLI